MSTSRQTGAPGTGGVGASDVEHLTTSILRRWRQRLRRRADARPRGGDRGESERLLVGALLRASSAQDDTILPGLAAAAAQYGAGQRRDRLDPGGLCDELSSLRQIVWSELKSHQSSVHEAVDRILLFDRALSIAVKAAVTAGYADKTFSGLPPCSESENEANRSGEPRVPNENEAAPSAITPIAESATSRNRTIPGSGHCEKMTSREFVDERGQLWQLWAVHPESLERRLAQDPHLTPPIERRTRRESRVQVTNPLMANGWLTFESRAERRRLAPIPQGWLEMDEEGLRGLLATAKTASNTQRLLK